VIGISSVCERLIPRNIITEFVCTYDGDEVFRAELSPASAANPLISITAPAPAVFGRLMRARAIVTILPRRPPASRFNDKNPQPHVVTLHLGPRAGRAAVNTRIRLADSQSRSPRRPRRSSAG
jgi:hypothetical protein